MFVRMVSISWPHDLPASASQSAGITGMGHSLHMAFTFPLCTNLAFPQNSYEAALKEATSALTDETETFCLDLTTTFD